MSIFIDEVTRKLTAEGYKVSEENGVLSANLGDGEEVKFAEKKIYNGLISMKGIKECGRLEHWVSDIRTFCGDYERAPHLAGADDAYRKILEYDEIVLAMRYDKETAEKSTGLNDDETEKFLHVKRLCDNVANYCEAYENGEPIDIPDHSDGFRVIYSVGSAKMAARFDRTVGFEFITWSDSKYPRFYENYDEAREKFAVLSGLVDSERVFNDEELETLCYCVYAVTEMCDTLTDDMTKLLENLGKKLDIAISKNLSAGRSEKNESAV